MTATVRSPAWQNRDAWLALLEELFDPATMRRLERLGIEPGWQALDVGAGRGSIARWLGRRVGPSGTVIATDLDTTLLDRLDEVNVEAIRHDVLEDGFPPASFDLIHCRAVLVHLPDAHRALERMVGWLRPGGVLMAEEPWFDIGLLSPDSAVARAVQELRRAGDVNCGLAGGLPMVMEEAGLEEINVEGELPFFNGASKLSSFFLEVVEGVIGPLAADLPEVDEEIDGARARFGNPDCRSCGWPRVAAWGRKPGRFDP